MNYIFSILFICCTIQITGQNSVEISTDFPGGSVVVTKIANDTVWLKPDLTDTEGEWFYWYFKASGISGKTITFKFDQKNVFAKYGPGYSLNNDQTWKWYGENRVVDNAFTFSFSEQDTTAYFSTAFPYTDKNLQEFLTHFKHSDQLIIDTLCFSPENRAIEKILIPALYTEPTYRILITLRHHACEMMQNYVLEGLIEQLINNINLQLLREDVEFLIIPFMDKDGVENGEQGKNRLPRDHNRDYSGESIHHSTAALRKMVPKWSEGKLRIALDLHCPWIHGLESEQIYMVGKPGMEENQLAFFNLLEKNSFGELKSYHTSFMPFGTSWNTSSNKAKGWSFGMWASTLDNISLAGTIEFPYADISGIPVSKDGARMFGKTIAYSLQEYLKTIQR